MNKLMLMLLCSPLLWAQDADVAEEMRVERMVVDVRVLDRKGLPITDITADEIELTSRRQNLEVLSWQWMPNSAPTMARKPGGEIVDLGTTEADDDAFWAPIKPGARTELDGRIVVFFLQSDTGPQLTRYLQYAVLHLKEAIAELNPSDYVAVFSYDFKLNLHLDLTRTSPLLVEALENAATGTDPIDLGSGTGRGSFADLINRYDADDAVNVEKALELVGDALAQFEGAKSVFFLGWGMGRRMDTRKIKKPAYDPAVDALNAANASVYVIDYLRSELNADPNMLRQLATDTGGYYRQSRRQQKTVFQQAFTASDGYYQLVFAIPDQADPKYRLKVTRKHRDLLVRKPINEEDFTF